MANSAVFAPFYLSNPDLAWTMDRPAWPQFDGIPAHTDTNLLKLFNTTKSITQCYQGTVFLVMQIPLIGNTNTITGYQTFPI